MSGFFGIIRSDGAAVEQALLDRVGRALEFRGPDGTHKWKKANAGFVFTFLNTGTPHQSHAQPVGPGGRYWLVGEVRLDARGELTAGLRENGLLTNADTSDEELFLQCWNLWGEESLQRIRGDFSFGLWDADRQSLYCARDFSGARPFFCAQGPGVFCFSNTLQALRLVPEISGDLDEFFIRDFLLEGQSSDPEHTVWRAARRLLSGHSLRFSEGKLEIQRFLQLPIEEPLLLKRPEEYLEDFRSLLKRTTSDRLPQGRVAFYLSGGLDSASVCATAARVAPERLQAGELKAFTVSWRPLLEDPEPEYAARTAQYLGLSHEVLEDDQILPDDETHRSYAGADCRIFLQPCPPPMPQNLRALTSRRFR